jgi:hypothetical protein
MIIQNGDEAGFSMVGCDYLNAINNRIYRGGYGRGWSSGITFNKGRWHDAYSGFHNVIIGNIVSGMYDNSSYHTDGNGIIIDLSAGYSGSGSEHATANTPPATAHRICCPAAPGPCWRTTFSLTRSIPLRHLTPQQRWAKRRSRPIHSSFDRRRLPMVIVGHWRRGWLATD